MKPLQKYFIWQVTDLPYSDHRHAVAKRHPVNTLPLEGGGLGWGLNGEDCTPINLPPSRGKGIF